MPIHDNVAFLHDGVKDDAQKVVILLMSSSLRLIAFHQLISVVSEVAKHAIFLDGETNVHPLLALLYQELRTRAGEDCNIKLASL